MNKILSVFFVAIIIVFCFSGCETAKNNSSTVTETQTQPKNANENKLETLKINDEIFSDIFLTYPEITERRGELCDVFFDNGAYYKFKNGFGGYGWDVDTASMFQDDGINWQKRENGKWILDTVVLPDENAVVKEIRNISPEIFFENIILPVNVSDLGKIPGVINFDSCPIDDVDTRYYYSFVYKDLYVYAVSIEKEVINSETYFKVYREKPTYFY